MSRPRTVLVRLATVTAGLVLLGGCAADGDADARIVLMETPVAPMTADAPIRLGAGDAAGTGVHDVLMARSGAAMMYATVDAP